jgi:hypothetical protein
MQKKEKTAIEPLSKMTGFATKRYSFSHHTRRKQLLTNRNVGAPTAPTGTPEGRAHIIKSGAKARSTLGRRNNLNGKLSRPAY